VAANFKILELREDRKILSGLVRSLENAKSPEFPGKVDKNSECLLKWFYVVLDEVGLGYG